MLRRASDEKRQWNYLNPHGLDFYYECGGDGEFGPIASYRIRRT